jgi:hypothetical protein
MEQISIWNEDTGRLVLHGAGIAAPFTGADFRSSAGPGESVRETIDLLLEDTSPSVLSNGLGAIERLLGAASSEAGPSSSPYLECIPAPGEDVWQSRVLSGWVEPLGGERAFGSLGVRLHLERENAWQGAEVCLPISNRSGTRVTSGLTLFNHCDSGAGHDNFAEIYASDLPGDLPGPARFEMRNPAGSAITCVYLFRDAHPDAGLFFPVILEAENASGGSSADDPACSGGRLRQISWSTGDPTLLFTWLLTDQTVTQANGRAFKAIARVPDKLSAADLWMRLVLKMDTYLLWAGAWILAPGGQELVELSTLRIPPDLGDRSPGCD